MIVVDLLGGDLIVYKEDIEKIFVDEIRQKKKIGTGAFHMRGKGVKHGFSGALRTPYHFMSTREKKKLNGEVKVSFMYEKIIGREELEKLPTETQKAMVTYWREKYTTKEIQNSMKIASQTFYDIVNRLELPKKPRVSKIKNQKTKKERIGKVLPIQEIKDNTPQVKEEVQAIPQPQVQGPIKLITNGLYLEYNGKYDADSLNKLFTKLQLLLDGETSLYNIELAISEIKEK